jgi:hypothetical protein
VATVTRNPEVEARRAKLRAATLRLFIGVVAVHGVALALYYGFHVGLRPDRTRTIFVAIWTFATAITVAFLLKRVREARVVTRVPRRNQG